MIMRSTIALAMMAVATAGCGEKPQTAEATNTAKKADAKAWEGAQGGNVAEGWKPGDKDSWEAQMRLRVQGQNEYSRSAAVAPAVSPAAAPTKTP
jgi:hypothetical protein